MKPASGACLSLLLVACGVLASFAQSPKNQATSPSWTVGLDRIRQVAGMIPGRRALRINELKFAESRRSKKLSVQGSPDEPRVQARTVFQPVFADGAVLLDYETDA